MLSKIASELLIGLVDGWTMKVKVVESNSPPLREGARIRQISEDRAKLVIEYEDDRHNRSDLGRSWQLRKPPGQEQSG
jgi:hypothetical protein